MGKETYPPSPKTILIFSLFKKKTKSIIEKNNFIKKNNFDI